ncbi:hypothetical protein D3C76_890910 [compost metagenome]
MWKTVELQAQPRQHSQPQCRKGEPAGEDPGKVQACPGPSKRHFDVAPRQPRKQDRSGDQQRPDGQVDGDFQVVEEGNQRPVPQVQRVGDQADEHHGPAGEQAGMTLAAAGEDQQGGAQAGDQGVDPGKGGIGVQGKQREADQQVTRQCKSMARQLADDPRRVQVDREQPAEHQFEKTRGQQVVGGRGEDPGCVLGNAHRQHHADGQHGQHVTRRQAIQQHDEQRPDDVELFFDTQRPGVQQRRFAGIGGEVVTVLDPDIDIRNAQQRQQGADVEPDQVDRRQDEGAGDHRRQQHRRQRRHDAVDAALIKALQRERIALDLGKHLGRDQETGDDKEDVNADEAAGQQAGL